MMEDLKLAWLVVNPRSDSKVTRRQLLDAVHFSGRNPSRKEMQEFCSTFGSDPMFSFDDFSKLCDKLHPTTLSELLNAFHWLDQNGDGKITRTELKEVLGKNGEHMTDKEVEEICTEFDRNNDGELDFKEFGSMMASLTDEIHSTTTRQRLLDQLSRAQHTATEEQQSAKRAAAQAPRAGKGGALTTPRHVGQEAQETAEPEDLKLWTCDRLHGTLQAAQGGHVFSEHYAFVLTEPCEMYLSLKLKREGTPADVALFLLKIDSNDEEPELIAFSHTHVEVDPCLRLSLEAGDYIVLPFSTGCMLHKRESQPKRAVPLSETVRGELELTDKAKAALTAVFHRTDLDGTGALRRREYDMLLERTDGEPCDDETWAYMTETFSDKRDHLTPSAFLAMYTQVLRAVEDADAFYSNFEALGYNKALQLDEAVCFTLFCFTKKKKVLQAFTAMAYDQARLESAVLRSIVNNGKKETVLDKLHLYSHRAGENRVSFAMENRSKMVAKIALDVGGSTNTRTHVRTSKIPVTVPPRSEAIVVHCMPDDPAQPWAVRAVVTTV